MATPLKNQKNKTEMLKKIGIALIAVLVIIQFFRPAKNISTAPEPNEISAKYHVPDNVYMCLQKACFDCHSNTTKYPWYNNIQPVAWWMASHIKDGKKHLNFSEFGSYPKKRKLKKLKEIGESVTEGWMPINSYLWEHKEAVLTKEETTAIANWADSLSQQIDKTEN